MAIACLAMFPTAAEAADAGATPGAAAGQRRVGKSAVWGWDPAPLRRFLGGHGGSALLKLGAFTVTLRKGGVPPVGENPLFITSVEREGTFDEVALSRGWLRVLENEGREAGFDALFVEGVDSPRVKKFFERRMQYAPFTSRQWLPSYYTLLRQDR